MNQDIAERAEAARDARNLATTLGVRDKTGILFQDTSPPQLWVTLWRTDTGEPVQVLEYHVPETLEKLRDDGQRAFTGRKENAPEYILNSVHCFMSKNSPERPILNELGIFKTCPAEHLSNDFAREEHARRKHRSEWRMYEAHLAKQADAKWRTQQENQSSAMMTLAERVAGTVTPQPFTPAPRVETIPFEPDESLTCDVCGKVAGSFIGLQGHKRSHKNNKGS